MQLYTTLFIGIDPGARWNAFAFTGVGWPNIKCGLIDLGPEKEAPPHYDLFCESLETNKLGSQLKLELSRLPHNKSLGLTALEVPDRKTARAIRASTGRNQGFKHATQILKHWQTWIEEISQGYCLVERVDSLKWQRSLLNEEGMRGTYSPSYEELTRAKARQLVAGRHLKNTHKEDAVCILQYGLEAHYAAMA